MLVPAPPQQASAAHREGAVVRSYWPSREAHGAGASNELTKCKPMVAACQGSLWKPISRGAACPLGPLATGFVPWGAGPLPGSRLAWWWEPQRLDQQGLDLTHLLLELFHFHLDFFRFFLHLINTLVRPVLASAHLIFQLASETTESTDEQPHASHGVATRAPGCKAGRTSIKKQVCTGIKVCVGGGTTLSWGNVGVGFHACSRSTTAGQHCGEKGSGSMELLAIKRRMGTEAGKVLAEVQTRGSALARFPVVKGGGVLYKRGSGCAGCPSP